MRKSEYPESPKTLGQIIRKKRMDSKLSLLQVAKKAGLTEGYLSRIEADKQVPAPEIMEAIGKFLEIEDAIYSPFLLEKLFPKDNPIHRLNKERTQYIARYHDLEAKIESIVNEVKKTKDEKLKKAFGDLLKAKQELDSTKWSDKFKPMDIIKERVHKKGKKS